MLPEQAHGPTLARIRELFGIPHNALEHVESSACLDQVDVSAWTFPFHGAPGRKVTSKMKMFSHILIAAEQLWKEYRMHAKDSKQYWRFRHRTKDCAALQIIPFFTSLGHCWQNVEASGQACLTVSQGDAIFLLNLGPPLTVRASGHSVCQIAPEQVYFYWATDGKVSLFSEASHVQVLFASLRAEDVATGSAHQSRQVSISRLHEARKTARQEATQANRRKWHASHKRRAVEASADQPEEVETSALSTKKKPVEASADQPEEVETSALPCSNPKPQMWPVERQPWHALPFVHRFFAHSPAIDRFQKIWRQSLVSFRDGHCQFLWTYDVPETQKFFSPLWKTFLFAMPACSCRSSQWGYLLQKTLRSSTGKTY